MHTITPEQLASLERASQAAASEKITRGGYIVGLMGVLIGLSAFSVFRIEILGFLVHPMLWVLLFAFPSQVYPKLNLFPKDVWSAGTWFAAWFVFCFLLGIMRPEWQYGFNCSVKLITGFLTLVSVSLLVQNKADIRLGLLGLVVGVFLMSFDALASQEYAAGLNVIEVGNKNAYSLYAIPGVLAAYYLLLEPKQSWWVKALVLACVLAIIMTVFMTGNRSGWVGVALVPLLFVFFQRNLKAFLIGCLLAYGGYELVTDYGSTAIYEQRMEKTERELKTGNIREDLFRTSIEIGLENPIVGASPQGVGEELAFRLRGEKGAIDTHNALGLIIGGTGLTGLLLFLILAWRIWKQSRRVNVNAGVFLKVILVSWIVRSMFSGEILFAPPFMVLIGLALGLIWISEKEASQSIV